LSAVCQCLAARRQPREQKVDVVDLLAFLDDDVTAGERPDRIPEKLIQPLTIRLTEPNELLEFHFSGSFKALLHAWNASLVSTVPLQLRPTWG
jgi:hypothetical protein